MNATTFNEPVDDGEWRSLFFSLRDRGFNRAAVGLWMDVLGVPLSIARDNKLDFDPATALASSSRIALCSEIVQRLDHELSQTDAADANCDPDTNHFREERGGHTQVESRASDEEAAWDACLLLHAIALDCAAFLKRCKESGVEVADLRRITAVIRQAFEHNNLERVCFNPQTGEFTDLMNLPPIEDVAESFLFDTGGRLEF